MHGLPGTDFLLGSLWRNYGDNSAFETLTRNKRHPGPQVSAFAPMGNRGMPTERTEMSTRQEIVFPGVLGHFLGRTLGPIGSTAAWDNNAPIVGSDESHVLATGTVPVGRASQIAPPILSWRIGWTAFASNTQNLPGLEEGQHPYFTGSCRRRACCGVQASRFCSTWRRRS